MRRSLRCLFLATAALFAGCGESGTPVSEQVAFRMSGTTERSPIPVSAAPAGAASTPPQSAMDVSLTPAPGPESDRQQSLLSTPRQTTIQSGTLTAGSIDDHERYSEFQPILQTAQSSGQLGSLRQFDGRRILIEVKNQSGEPVADARIRVHADQASTSQLKYQPQSASESGVFEVTTGTDGRALVLPSLDGLQSTEFTIEVRTQENPEPFAQKASSNQTPWIVTMPDAPAQRPQQLDLALVIDTTGSMLDELEYLKVEIDSIAAQIHAMYPQVDQRYALILYRDHGDEYVTRTFAFTKSLGDFRQQLARQSANGGGDVPEAMHVALEQATRLSWRAEQTARVLFLVGDAPPHSHEIDLAMQSVQELRRQNVTMFPVAASGVHREAEAVLRMSAFLTMGEYLFLTDHSGIGLPHDTPQTSSYVVERLDQLMVRMIASELAGKKLLPADILAIERPGQSLPQFESTQQQAVVTPVFVEIPVRVTASTLQPATWEAIRIVAAVVGLVILIALERLRSLHTR